MRVGVGEMIGSGGHGGMTVVCLIVVGGDNLWMSRKWRIVVDCCMPEMHWRMELCC